MQGDAAAVAKTLRDYARTNPNLVVKGGLLGDKVLSAADVVALADLPSRDVMLARLAGALQAPLVKMAGLLQALPRNFAYGLQALIDQRGGAPRRRHQRADDAAGVSDDHIGASGPADDPSGAASAADEPAAESSGEPETNDAAAPAEE